MTPNLNPSTAPEDQPRAPNPEAARAEFGSLRHFHKLMLLLADPAHAQRLQDAATMSRLLLNAVERWQRAEKAWMAYLEDPRGSTHPVSTIQMELDLAQKALEAESERFFATVHWMLPDPSDGQTHTSGP